MLSVCIIDSLEGGDRSRKSSCCVVCVYSEPGIAWHLLIGEEARRVPSWRKLTRSDG